MAHYIIYNNKRGDIINILPSTALTWDYLTKHGMEIRPLFHQTSKVIWFELMNDVLRNTRFLFLECGTHADVWNEEDQISGKTMERLTSLARQVTHSLFVNPIWR